jgi:hypothetical protein
VTTIEKIAKVAVIVYHTTAFTWLGNAFAELDTEVTIESPIIEQTPKPTVEIDYDNIQISTPEKPLTDAIVAHYTKPDKNGNQIPLKYWGNKTVDEIEGFTAHVAHLVDITYKACEQYPLEGIDYPRYIISIAMQESQLNPDIEIEGCGAGIMMFVTSTAAEYNMTPEDRLTPELEPKKKHRLGDQYLFLGCTENGDDHQKYTQHKKEYRMRTKLQYDEMRQELDWHCLIK